MRPVTHARSALVGLASALALALTGCGGAAQPSDEIVVLCGTSFVPPVEKLAKQYEEATGRKITLSMGGSEDLLPQVKTHAAGDLFVTHDPYMDETEKAGAMLRWVQVGHLAPALVVAKGNPKKIERLEDLARPGLNVILPNPEFATCGKLVVSLLEKKGVKDAVMANVGNRLFRSHSQIGNNMKLGHGDAAIMWNGVAHNYLDALEIVPTPYEYDTETRVGVIGLSYSKNKDQVEQFLKYVEEHGRAVFTEFGYVKEIKEVKESSSLPPGGTGTEGEGIRP
jgi:molybdate transport system substrate-binding protein